LFKIIAHVWTQIISNSELLAGQVANGAGAKAAARLYPHRRRYALHAKHTAVPT
jgi:hypothetical protein